MTLASLFILTAIAFYVCASIPDQSQRVVLANARTAKLFIILGWLCALIDVVYELLR